jgi:hypothetical protein
LPPLTSTMPLALASLMMLPNCNSCILGN